MKKGLGLWGEVRGVLAPRTTANGVGVLVESTPLSFLSQGVKNSQIGKGDGKKRLE